MNDSIFFEEISKSNIDVLYEVEKQIYKDIVPKKEFLKNINLNEYSLCLLIKSKDTLKYYGILDMLSIDYIDGYMYIKIRLLENVEEICTKVVQESVNFLLNQYPIRKIYYELYLHEIDMAKYLKSAGFTVEVKFEKYGYYNQKLYNKYLLTLNRGDFCCCE